MVSKKEIVEATKRAAAQLAKTPTVVSAKYEPKLSMVMVELSTGIIIMFAPGHVQELEQAKPDQLNEIEISPSGLGLYFPAVDADVYIPGLLEGAFGSRNWMAAKLGKAGGRAKSRAKAVAARENGRLGGRPRKAHATGTRARA